MVSSGVQCYLTEEKKSEKFTENNLLNQICLLYEYHQFFLYYSIIIIIIKIQYKDVTGTEAKMTK